VQNHRKMRLDRGMGVLALPVAIQPEHYCVIYVRQQ
jgi:hypothetical protein